VPEDEPLHLDPDITIGRVRHVLTVPATLGDVPVYYDYGKRPVVLSFCTDVGTKVEIKLSLDDYEDLLERQLATIETIRSDALK
jgi:hypothetical protein